MENTPHLYETLVLVLCQHATWLDQRHLKTLAWMMVGLIHAGGISLTAWAPYVVSRARYAQSTVRRFRRWLDNDKIDALSLYGPFMEQALVQWGEQALYVALDTSMWWNTYCLIRLSVIYRGRAVPLAWCVLQHGSAQVEFEVYQDLLERAALLLPRHCNVILLADRGCADTGCWLISNDWAGIGGFGSRAAFGSIAAGVRAAKSSASPWPGGRPVSGSRCPSPKSAMVRCISLWRARGKDQMCGRCSVMASIIGSATWPPSDPRKLSDSIPVEVETRGRPRHP